MQSGLASLSLGGESLYVKHQGPTNILLEGGQEFFDSNEIRELPARKRDGNREETENDGQASMFVCPEEG